MQRRIHGAGIGLLVALMAMLAAASAAAQPAEPTSSEEATDETGDKLGCKGEPKACARDAFAEATAAFEREDWALALKHFERAEQLAPHPVIAFNVALTLTHLGRYVKAVEIFDAVLTNPETSEEVKEQARAVRKDADASVAQIVIIAPGNSAISVELDGQQYAENESSLRVDPGRHALRVMSGGSVVLDQSVRLSPGERMQLVVTRKSTSIDVVVVPEEQPTKPPPPAPPAPAPAAEPMERVSPLWFYVAAGATLAVGGVTAWSGLDTIQAKDDYDRDLPDLSRDVAQERLDEGHAKERRTNLLIGGTTLLGVGAAALAFFVVDWNAPSQPTVAVTPSSLHLTAKF